MFIKSISLKNFKKFSELKVDFPADITVVRGPNERGKSTLLSAFLAGLFYDPKKSNQDIQALKSWNSDRMYEIGFNIEHDGDDLEFYKNFESGEAYLANKSKSEKLTTHIQIGEYLYKIGALRSLALFEHTACVEHDALSRVAEGKKDISQALLGLLTSSSENISSEKILKKVSEIVSDLQRGSRVQAKRPGFIKQLASEIEELETERAKIARDLEQGAGQTAQIGALNQEYEKAKNGFEAKKNQYEKNLAYFKTIEELNRLNAQLTKINADFETLKEIADKKKYLYFQLNKMSALANFDWEKFSRQKETLAAKKEKFSHFQREAAQLKKEKKSAARHIKKPHLIATLAFFALGFLGFLDQRLFALFGLFFTSFIYSFVLKKGYEIHTGAVMSREAEGLSHEIAVIERQTEKMLEENGARDEKELIHKVKTYNEYGGELARLESKEEGVLRGGAFDDFARSRNDLLNRVAVEGSKIFSAENNARPPAPEEQRSLEIEMQKYQKELELLQKEIAQLEAAANISRADGEALARAEEKIEYAQKRKERGERKMKVLGELQSALAEAQNKAIAQSRSHIEEYMRRYLSAITDGRYHNVRVKDDLSFEVWSDDKKGMIVPEENLSKGTIDQFYLLARFAILDILNKGVKSLVLLDDPFLGFDAGRKARTKEILADLSSAFQIIIFTHSPEYDDWGKVVEI